ASLAAFGDQDLPFEEVVETLERERDLKPAALSQIMILLQNAALRPITGSGHALAFEEADPSMLLPLVTTTTFDVVLMLHESAHGLTGSCVYRPQLFRPTAIARLLGDFQNVLEWMVTHPDRPISAIRVSSSRRDRK